MTRRAQHSLTERLPPIPQDSQSTEQKAAIKSIVEGPRRAFGGPFVALLRNPELLNRVQRVGEYLRWGSALAPSLRELTILITVRRWEQPHEWATHATLAVQEGVPREIVAEIAARQRPARSSAAILAVYDFCDELLERHVVSDATYVNLREVVGETGVIDVLGLCGYYVGISMVLNVARPPLEPGTTPFDC